MSRSPSLVERHTTIPKQHTHFPNLFLHPLHNPKSTTSNIRRSSKLVELHVGKLVSTSRWNPANAWRDLSSSPHGLCLHLPPTTTRASPLFPAAERKSQVFSVRLKFTSTLKCTGSAAVLNSVNVNGETLLTLNTSRGRTEKINKSAITKFLAIIGSKRVPIRRVRTVCPILAPDKLCCVRFLTCFKPTGEQRRVAEVATS